jgi:hypothetical protein
MSSFFFKIFWYHHHPLTPNWQRTPSNISKTSI